VERADGQVLLVRHSYRQSWGLPGGLLKRGEDPATAALREAAEEVGLAVDLDGEPTVVRNVKRRGKNIKDQKPKKLYSN